MNILNRSRYLGAAVVAFSLLVASCGDDGSSDEAPSTTLPVATTTTVVSVSTTIPTETTSPSATTQTVTTIVAVPETEVDLAIAPDGLLLVRSDGKVTAGGGTSTVAGSTTPLTFGAPQAQVMQTLTATLGEPTNAGAASEECPNGEDFAASWDQAIGVSFIDGSLLSWSLRPGSPITDIAGIGLGSTVAELTSVHYIEIAPSSLGTEFHSVGATPTSGYGGLLTGDSSNSTVTNLWAGSICAFR